MNRWTTAALLAVQAATAFRNGAKLERIREMLISADKPESLMISDWEYVHESLLETATELQVLGRDALDFSMQLTKPRES